MSASEGPPTLLERPGWMQSCHPHPILVRPARVKRRRGGGLIYDHFGSYDHAWRLGVAIGLVAGVAQMMTDDQPGRPILREASA